MQADAGKSDRAGDRGAGSVTWTGLPPEATPVAAGPARLAAEGARYPFRLLGTFYLAIASAVREGRRGRRLAFRVFLQQVYFSAVQALPIILMISIVFGALAMVQASVELPRFGVRKVEAVTGILIFRELAPITVAIVVIARSANAIIVEIGNMKVSGEIRALEIAGANIDRLVVLPRLLALAISVPLLTGIFIAATLWGGYAAGRASGLLASNFTLARLSASLDAGVVGSVLARAIFFGLAIGTVSCHHGLHVRLAGTEVPQQATRGVIGALTLCFLGNLVLSIAVL